MKNCAEPLDNYNNCKKVLRFADDSLKNTLYEYIDFINERNENERRINVYEKAKKLMNNARSENQFNNAINLFNSIMDFKDSSSLVNECLKKIEDCRTEKENQRIKLAKSKKKIKIIALISLVIVSIIAISIFIVYPSIKKNMEAKIIAEAEELYLSGEALKAYELLYENKIYDKAELYLLVSEEKYALAVRKGLTHLVIPNGTTTIRFNTFENCTELLSIVIPDSVTIIERYAFSRCTNLKSITLSNSLTTIQEHAFSGCTSLEKIIIPKSVNVIGPYAFYGATALTIYCEASKAQSAWNAAWNYSERPVVWNYTGD